MTFWQGKEIKALKLYSFDTKEKDVIEALRQKSMVYWQGKALDLLCLFNYALLAVVHVGHIE
jgi:hypothetical protein